MSIQKLYLLVIEQVQLLSSAIKLGVVRLDVVRIAHDDSIRFCFNISSRCR